MEGVVFLREILIWRIFKNGENVVYFRVKNDYYVYIWFFGLSLILVRDVIGDLFINIFLLCNIFLRVYKWIDNVYVVIFFNVLEIICRL